MNIESYYRNMYDEKERADRLMDIAKQIESQYAHALSVLSRSHINYVIGATERPPRAPQYKATFFNKEAYVTLEALPQYDDKKLTSVPLREIPKEEYRETIEFYGSDQLIMELAKTFATKVEFSATYDPADQKVQIKMNYVNDK